MPFSDTDKAALLALKGVGPTVLKRLEEMGFHDLASLRQANVDDITAMAAQITGSSCWRNSPQAKAAIAAILDYAKSHL
ncbi:MAG: helix-hairpin-helix domain-containing protein [Neisseriaceae bacterium]|nr:helix-hairpin-helix domain-containing protein [Neisseriaceae bacterium]